MPLRSSLVVIVISATSLLLWLSLLFFSFHGGGHPVNSRSASNTLVPRKVLLGTVKFDVSTFHSTEHSVNNHHHHHRRRRRRHRHRHHQHSRSPAVVKPKPSPDDGDGIDPRYGVQKRLVPTGPNPLHH